MTLNTQPYKGMRDFYPSDKRLQKFMFSSLRKTVESFGYQEYDAPVLESLELYQAKSGEEIVNQQTYRFEDRGGRMVAMRPEMTPSVSRMVAAKRQELSYPLRLYSIPNLWRYERPQRGRYREHWQLNVDLFGEASINAEVEMISLSDQIFQGFGADRSMYTIKLNSRRLMDKITKDYLTLDEPAAVKLTKLIDRSNKLEESEYKSAALEILSEDQLTKLNDVLSAKSLDDLPEVLKNTPASSELKTLITSLNLDNVVYDPSLMRGFDYYTDIVFEIFDTHPENNRSMMGGGRYDGLVGLFGVEPISTIGFGLGDATLSNFLELHSLLPELKNEIDLAVLPLQVDAGRTRDFVNSLRSKGVNLAVDYSERKLGNKIRWAEGSGINHIIVVGENELNSGQFKLKNLKSGEETDLNLDTIYDQVKQ